MNNIPKIPSVHEIRAVIKNILKYSQDVSGTIKIDNIDSATSLAAQIFGFNSWKEYQIALKKNNNKAKKQNSSLLLNIEDKEFTDQNFLFENYTFDSQLTENKNFPELIPSYDISQGFIIGTSTDKFLKRDEIIELKNEMLIVTSSKNTDMNKMLKNQLNWLIQYQQGFVVFGLPEDNTLNITKIGQNHLQLDPLNEILDYEGVEYLFDDIKENEFLWMWVNIIQTIKKEHKIQWSATSLIKTLSLNNLMTIWEKFKHQLVGQYLENYLINQCKIIKNDSGYNVSALAQKIHFTNTYQILARLKEIDNLYEEGYFSYQPKVFFKDLIFKKQQAVVFDCKNSKLTSTHNKIINCAYYSMLKKQLKEIGVYNPKKFSNWSLWYKAEDWFNSSLSYQFLELTDLTKIQLYVSNNNDFLTPWFMQTQQIVFLEQNTLSYDFKFQQRMFNITQSWDENIWLNDMQCLHSLKTKAFYWFLVSEDQPEGLSNYNLKKINLLEDIDF